MAITHPYRGYIDLAGKVMILQRDSGWRCSIIIEEGQVEWEGSNFRIHTKFFGLANCMTTGPRAGELGRVTIDILGMTRLPPFLYEAMECDFKRKEITIYGSGKWLLQKTSQDSTGIPTLPTRPIGLPIRAAKRAAARG